MLRQQTEEASTKSSAACVRVRPEELVEAVSTVERRKAEEMHYRAETISLGEAVDQLSLNTTAEELLQEIEAQHRAKQAEEARLAKASATVALQTPVAKKQPRRFSLTKLVLGVSLLANLGLVAMLSQVSFISHPTPVRQNATELLKFIPDNQSVYISLRNLYALKQGQSQDKIRVSGYRTTNTDSNGMTWEIFKLNGEIFVRGWSKAPLTQDKADIYSDKYPNNDSATPVTLPLKKFPAVLDPAQIDTIYGREGINLPMTSQ